MRQTPASEIQSGLVLCLTKAGLYLRLKFHFGCPVLQLFGLHIMQMLEGKGSLRCNINLLMPS